MKFSNMHWSRLEENTCVWGIRLLYACHRYLGRWFFKLILCPVVLFYWLSIPRVRRASLEYLQQIEQATGALGNKPTIWHTLRHLFIFAETLLDKLLAISGQYPLSKVQSSGHEIIYQRLLAKQGGILVTAHMGCLELCQVMGEHMPNIHINVLVHTHHAKQFNRLLQKLNPLSNISLIEVNDINPATALMLSEKISAGELVAIAGDRVPLSSGRTIQAPFLGKNAPFPIGPYLLAHLLHCPLYGMGCIHIKDGYLLAFSTLAEQVYLPRKEREQALVSYASCYASLLTRLLHRSPYDWFNFYSFWNQSNASN